MSETKWDQTRFNDAVNKMLARTSRDIPDAVNQTMANVAGRTINDMKMADKFKVKQALGQSAKGKRRKSFNWKEHYVAAKTKDAPLAALIINARRGRVMKPGLQGWKMEQAIRRMIGARLRSVGFMKSGGVPGYSRLLKSIARNPFRIAKLAGITVRGKDKGESIPAKEGFQPTASWSNTTKKAETYGKEALRDAMEAERREIERHLAEKMNPSIKEFNKK